jgi:hypothetical protein
MIMMGMGFLIVQIPTLVNLRIGRKMQVVPQISYVLIKLILLILLLATLPTLLRATNMKKFWIYRFLHLASHSNSEGPITTRSALMGLWAMDGPTILTSQCK